MLELFLFCFFFNFQFRRFHTSAVPWLHMICLLCVSNTAVLVTRLMSYKKKELLTLREHLGSLPVFFMGHVLLTCLVFCVVLNCFVYFCSMSCAQCCFGLRIVHSWIDVMYLVFLLLLHFHGIMSVIFLDTTWLCYLVFALYS